MNSTLQPVVRPMQIADADAVAELSGQLGYPTDAVQVRRRIGAIDEQSDAAVMVAEDADGRVVGWIHVYLVRMLESEDHVEVGGLVIADGMRGRGIGRLLLQAGEAWAVRIGCRTMRVRSQVFRNDAHRFYEHLGYEYIKTQKNFRKIVSFGASPA